MVFRASDALSLPKGLRRFSKSKRLNRSKNVHRPHPGVQPTSKQRQSCIGHELPI
jgi:hypothetical protein